MKGLQSELSRRLLLFEKLLAIIKRERHIVMSGDTERLALLSTKKQRVMDAIDAHPLEKIPAKDMTPGVRASLALIREKIQAVMKENEDNQRFFKGRMDAMSREMRSLKKSSTVRSAYQRAGAPTSIFLDDKK